MSDSKLSERLGAFRTWKQAQLRLLNQLRPWLQQQGLLTAEARSAIERAMQALGDDRLTIAVAGEFSRGKTELINALFFTDYRRRLLPTDAGRTTMCPTEIFSDAGQPPQLRLLPIETRRADLSLAALRDDADAWQSIELPLDDADALVARLQLLTQHKFVSRQTAAELGFAADPANTHGDQVGIPSWRLAQINIPHPLLAQGLRILDTPGLNAIGSEPELTYEMLPAAQAVLFVLGADTGVTHSDLHIWEHYIQRKGQPPRPGVLVVLNKTDTLWDDMRSKHQITESILRQCRGVASTLGVNGGQVFALSAQKALLSRVQRNQDLERRSGIIGLERYLGEVLMGNRMDIIRHEHTLLVSETIEGLQRLVESRLKRNAQQHQALQDLAGRSDTAITQMLAKTQAEHARYQTSVDAYKADVATFNGHAQQLLVALDPGSLQPIFDDIHNTMTGAWTTAGLKSAMQRLFKDVSQRVKEATTQTQAMRRQLRTTFRRMHTEQVSTGGSPNMYSLVKHQVELDLLEQEAEIFRNSARTTLTEQHFVTKRYFDTIVNRLGRVFTVAYQEAQQWSSTAFAGLSAEIKERRDALAAEMLHMREAAESRKTVQQRIELLRRDHARLQAQTLSLGKVRTMLTEPGGSFPSKKSA